MKIRRYTSRDIPKLLDLVRIVHNEGIYHKAAQRFQWQYEKNPNNTSEGPLIFILEHDEKIIGMIGAFAQRLKIGETIYPAFWVGDYMVHPDFRLSFNAIKLAKKIALHPGLMLGFPAENTVNLWFRAKAIQFSQLVEYSKNLVLKERIINSLGWRPSKEIQIIEIKEFDEGFDRLWEKISGNHKAIQVRDSRFLNWRFIKCPHLTYRIFAAVTKGEISGYIVIRDEMVNKIHEGNIVDIVFDRPVNNAGNSLMHAGINALRTKGCKVIKMVISSNDKVLNDLLCQFSFSLAAMKERGIVFNNMDEGLNSIIQDPSDWFLTKADSDIDFS